MMVTSQFKFILCATVKILRIIAPADKILQSEDAGLLDSIPIIKAVYTCLRECRLDEVYVEILNDSQCSKFNSQSDGNDDGCVELPYPRPKRKITPNTLLNDFVLTSSSGIYSNEPTRSSAAEDNDNPIKRFFF